MESNSEEYIFHRISKINNDFPFWHSNKNEPTKPIDLNTLLEKIKKALLLSIEKRVTSESTGVWISGGINSALLAAGLKRLEKNFQTFTVGLSNSLILEDSKKIAYQLSCQHHTKIITLQEVLKIVPEIIGKVVTFNRNIIYSGIANYVLTKFSSEYVTSTLNGTGSEFIFGSLSRKTSYDVEQKLCTTDLFSNHHGVVVRFPYLDNVMIDSLTNYQNIIRLNKYWVKDQLCANLFESNSLTRTEIHSQDLLIEELSSEFSKLCGEMISDHDFNSENNLKNGIRLRTKEDLFFYRIFKEQFSSLFN